MVLNWKKPIGDGYEHSVRNSTKLFDKKHLVFVAANVFENGIRSGYIERIVTKGQSSITFNLNIAAKGIGGFEFDTCAQSARCDFFLMLVASL